MKKIVGKVLLLVFTVSVLSIALSSISTVYAQGSSRRALSFYNEPLVREYREYNWWTGIYTYTYVLENWSDKPIWWWGIWFAQDPNGIFNETGTPDAQGIMPGDTETCCTGWKNTAFSCRAGYYAYAGPYSQPGFYSTYANDFVSQQVPNIGYWEGGIFIPLWTAEQMDAAVAAGQITAAELAINWTGGRWGWAGAGANILSASAIQVGEKGVYTFTSTTRLTGSKSFFYNTTDYWNMTNASASAINGLERTLVLEDFEGTGTTTRGWFKWWDLRNACNFTIASEGRRGNRSLRRESRRQ